MPSNPARNPQTKKRSKVPQDAQSAVALVLLASVGAYYFDHQEAGLAKIIRNGAYQYLQEKLPWQKTSKIQIVDISNIKQDGEGVTSRNTLQKLLDNLISDKRHLPLAIGFDIDFSPEKDQLAPGDLAFFQECLNTYDKGVKVFLGVHRTLGGSAKLALGSSYFAPLVSTLLVPRDAQHFVSQLGTEDSGGAQSMVTKLASVLQFHEERDHKPSDGPTDRFSLRGLAQLFSFCKTASEDSETSSMLRESLMNYGRSHDRADVQTRFSVIRPKDDLSFREEDYEAIDRAIVLVGDVQDPQASDVFADPVLNGATIPGVVLQAIGVYSSAIAPLCEVTESRDFFADLSLGLFAICVNVAAVFVFGNNLSSKHSEERLEKVVDFALGSLVLMFGALVNGHRIFWPGFLLVALALFVHPYITATANWILPLFGRELRKYLEAKHD